MTQTLGKPLFENASSTGRITLLTVEMSEMYHDLLKHLSEARTANIVPRRPSASSSFNPPAVAFLPLCVVTRHMTITTAGVASRASLGTTAVAGRASGSNQIQIAELSRFDVLKHKHQRVEIPSF